MGTRREFLTQALWTSGAAMSFSPTAFALFGSSSGELIDPVQAACKRLAAAGWRDLLLTVTGGAFDLGSTDLAAELGKRLNVNREVVGFADFAAAGERGVEPGQPARSLLYHAFASPDVVHESLTEYPTLAEIDALENYVYGARPPALADLQKAAGDNPLGVVMMALQYRPARDTVDQRHADLVFSRTGISRMGTVEPIYNARARNFEATVPGKPFEFPAIPQRFAPFLAVRVPGSDPRLALLDRQKGDEDHAFWLPVQKLFTGSQCLAGEKLKVELGCAFRNEKLRKFHRFLQLNGYPTEWAGDDLDQYPFVMKDADIAAFSKTGAFGPGVVEPRAAPFVNRAKYKGEWLGFQVPREWVATNGVVYFSSGQILGGEADTEEDFKHGEYLYFEGAGADYDRNAPEYVSLRHRLREDGTLEDLNANPEMGRMIREGGYKAQHFIDFAGDGWVEARVTGLPAEMPRMAAYAPISPPDFFPLVSQHDLMKWWTTEVPAAIRDGLWAIPPYALSARRMAANIELPIGFSIYDVGASAVVAQAQAGKGPLPKREVSRISRYSGLPDHSPGLFDPGWDASQGLFYNNPEEGLQAFLQNHGLGTPFVEDVKLCAALGSYWPAIAPDSTRSFSPLKNPTGYVYPWPTIVPLTDAETGIEPVGERFLPWDGVRGPQLVMVDGKRAVEYADIDRVDYAAMPNTMTIAQIAQVDLAETKARVMAMASVYWALGIRDADFRKRWPKSKARAITEITRAKAGWAVSSFRSVNEDEIELLEAQKTLGVKLSANGPRYRFHIYRPGVQTPHPEDMRKVRVSIKEEAVAFVDGRQVLIRRGRQAWKRDVSMPRS
ncbi:hypothetical protein DFR24_4266 [Panacagrimonas perspica]|uniref:Uncharacterized protein n=1 Tax=Panacagrimonas perspica TaxID=381431 RepID=A0A4R7NYK9_9GAMM|nr:hypothetical protein [Panacagrimonas perspica]TDU25821.1 hypothetical protein DFR24_4266 [Panacagrimonas perspica]